MGSRSSISLCPAQVLSADGESAVAVLKEGSLFGEVHVNSSYMYKHTAVNTYSLM